VIPELLSVSSGMRPDTVVDLLDGTVAGVEDRRADDIALMVLHLPLGLQTWVGARPGTPRALVIDEHRRVLDGNAGALADLGYSREELVTLRTDDLVIAPTDADDIARRLADAGGWTGTTTLRRRDGTPVTYAADASMLRTAERTIHLARLVPEGVPAEG